MGVRMTRAEPRPDFAALLVAQAGLIRLRELRQGCWHPPISLGSAVVLAVLVGSHFADSRHYGPQRITPPQPAWGAAEPVESAAGHIGNQSSRHWEASTITVPVHLNGRAEQIACGLRDPFNLTA